MKYLYPQDKESHRFAFPELKDYVGFTKPFKQKSDVMPEKKTDEKKNDKGNTANIDNKSILIIASDIFRSSNLCKFLDMVLKKTDKIVTGIWAVRNIDENIRKRLLQLKSENRLAILKGDDDSSFLGYIRRYIDKIRFTVVTHSLTLQMSLSIISKELKTKNILISDVADGELVPPDTKSENKKPVFEPTSAVISDISSEPVRIKGRMPRTGSKVRTDSGQIITLGNICGAPGGEADVYHINDDDKHLVKIYRSDTNTPLRYAKIRILIEKAKEFRRLDSSLAARMAFPLEAVYNRFGEPVGFTMPYFADMKPLEGANVAKTFPNATRREVIDLAVSVAELARFAAVNNLYLGDVLTSGNILFNDKCEAVMIDLDSTQFTIDGKVYPTNVGKIEYLSPERISQNEYNFIRTKADDEWSLALMIFSIITVINSTPYISTRKKGSRVNEGLKHDVKNGRYGFIPGSNMAEVICNLPCFIRWDFFNTFSSKGENFREKTRFSAQHWLMECLKYRSELKAGRLSDAENKFILCA